LGGSGWRFPHYFSSNIGQYTPVWGIESNLVGDFAHFSRVHLGEIVDHHSDCLYKGISVETIKSHHRNQLQQNGLRLQTNSKDFNNQVTVKSGNASIKIFTNGRVHCTGSQSLVFFIECMNRLCSTLSVTLERAEIVMINLNFGCQRSIPLPILKDYLGVSYDPDCYSGVKGW
jgi:hypothetical protein